eukprot:2150450-Prymnesium_polylepis.2
MGRDWADYDSDDSRVDDDGYIYDDDGHLILDEQGRPIRVRCTRNHAVARDRALVSGAVACTSTSSILLTHAPTCCKTALLPACPSGGFRNSY